MFRRSVIRLGLWASVLALRPAAAASKAAKQPTHTEVDQLAQAMAESELAEIQRAYPTSWQSLSYIGDRPTAYNLQAFYCVTGEQRVIDQWGARVERAMFPGSLAVYAIGQAGTIPNRGEGFRFVTVLICDRQGVELERRAFADMRAKNRRTPDAQHH